MPAHLIATVRSVKDRRGMEEYWSRAESTFEGSGAEPLAVYTPFTLLEGKGPVEGIVTIEFPDMEAARRWYGSATYQVKQYREGAADIEVILVEGGVVAAPDQRMPHTKGDAQKSQHPDGWPPTLAGGCPNLVVGASWRNLQVHPERRTRPNTRYP